jgi:hypothetical protein
MKSKYRQRMWNVDTALDIIEKHKAMFELKDKKKPNNVRQLDCY